MVPLTGLEPVQYHYPGILSPLCLPIPPQRQVAPAYDSTTAAIRQVLQLVQIQRKGFQTVIQEPV